MIRDCLVSGQGHESGTFLKNKTLGESSHSTTRQESKIKRELPGHFHVSVILYQQCP